VASSPLINTWAKGRFIEKCMLPLGTDHILVIPLQSTGIPTDTVLRNCANLAAVFTAGGLEATFSNYSRISLSSSAITITTNTSTFFQAASFTSQVWAAAGGAVNNTFSALVLAYQPTTGTADSGCLVLATLAYAGSTTAGALTAAIGTLTDT
jgi:hypothetical protein